MALNELIISDLAIEQIDSIFTYHESNHDGKGSDFLEAVWDCFEKIQLNPERWQFLRTREDNIRRAITEKPQTIILYSIDSDKIIILEVWDSKQNWKR
ncbi:MAG: type II toxin-antitoxin system RelE/ParE family toxin [Bacteroidia bacterium]